MPNRIVFPGEAPGPTMFSVAPSAHVSAWESANESAPSPTLIVALPESVSAPVAFVVAPHVTVQPPLSVIGEVVGNAISPEPLEKGRQYVDWDLTGPDDGARAPEGEYTYKAIWIPEHTLTWRGCFYPTPLPAGATPWHKPAGTGGRTNARS